MLSIETITISSGPYNGLFKIVLFFVPFKNQEKEISEIISNTEELEARYFETYTKNKMFKFIIFLAPSEINELIEDIKEKNMTKILMKYNSGNKTLDYLYESLLKNFDISRSIIL